MDNKRWKAMLLLRGADRSRELWEFISVLLTSVGQRFREHARCCNNVSQNTHRPDLMAPVNRLQTPERICFSVTGHAVLRWSESSQHQSNDHLIHMWGLRGRPVHWLMTILCTCLKTCLVCLEGSPAGAAGCDFRKVSDKSDTLHIRMEAHNGTL